MISKIKVLPICAATIGVMFIGAATAADGTITINGMVTDTTCNISVDGGSENATVTLPTVSTNTLSNPGDTAGATPFSIVLSGCAGVSLTNASTYFEPGTYVDDASGRLDINATPALGSAAGNVQVQLLNSNSSPIIAGASTTTGQNDVLVDISSGSGTMNYYARYYATGASTPGVVNTQVDYTIVYP